jgi:hypothetical protein
VAIGEFFNSIGDSFRTGSERFNRAVNPDFDLAMRKIESLQQIGEVMSSPVTPGEKVNALARLDPAFAMQYAKQMKGPEAPADVREFEYMQSLPEDQRQAYQQFKQPAITPYQQQQLDIRRQELQNNPKILKQNAQEEASQLYAQSKELASVGRRQEANELRMQADEMLSSVGAQRKLTPGEKVLEKEEAKQIQKEREAASEATKMIGNIVSMRSALQKSGNTGPIAGSMPAVFDPIIGDSGSRQFARTKSTEFQLAFTNMTKGAISDREMALFAAAPPGLGRDEEANEKILNGMEAASRRAQERAEFIETYKMTNGTLRGAERAWSSFIDQNPILDKDLNLNVDNIDNWQDYITRDMRSPESQNINLPSADAIEAELKRRGVM